MNNKLLSKIIKKITAIVLVVSILSTSVLSGLLPFSLKQAHAKSQCSASSLSSSSRSRFPSSGRVGGVSLDQAAKFLADMSEVTGAYYDDSTDRIIFVGKEEVSAPKFDKDDLAVAIKAIMFNGELPWVSLEGTNPDPDLVDAVYSPGIENTKFGDILIKADIKLKHYVIGTDENNQPMTSNVSGYKPRGKIYEDLGPLSTNPGGASRYWITPKDMTLKRDNTEKSFVFDAATMEIQTEAMSQNNDPLYDQSAESFAQHFTNNYDSFAAEAPIFSDAKRLGQVAAIIKWINDSGITTDFHWARDYEAQRVDTPDSYSKFESPTYNYSDTGTYTIIGGAELFTDNGYVTDSTGESVNLKTASENTQPTKEDVHWTFTHNSENYEAVAVTAEAFRSIGSYNTSATDMAFPTAGDLTLSFQRAYSSFSGGQYGIGQGWNIFPAALYDNKPTYPATTLTCVDGVYPKALAFVSQTGGLESFTINDCNIGYVSDDAAYHSKIVRNTNGTFTVTLKNQTKFNFDSTYRLTNITDKNNNTVSYNYDGSSRKLISIEDSQNHDITINYSTFNGRELISSITDWDNNTVAYNYDSNGNLLTVTDPLNNVITYTYDSNNKLTTITNRNNQLVLTNTYTDEAKVATSQNAANIISSYTYDHVNRDVTATDNQTPNRSQITTYDTKGRVLEIEDPYANSITYTYGTEFAPLTVTDKRNNTITNTYDSNGNLTSVTYPDNKVVTYEYDNKNRVIEITDERYGTGVNAKVTTFTYDSNNGNLLEADETGQETSYTYNAAGEMLTRTDDLNHTFTWTRDSMGNMLTQVDPTNKTTTYEYDPVGRLTKLTDANNKVTTYIYDDNGNRLTESNSVGTTTFQYDDENRLTKTIYPNNTDVDFAYNSSGSLTSVTDQANNVTNYSYDAYQNLTQKEDALDKISINAYDKLNRKTQTTSDLGKVKSWAYDANGNITSRTDENNDETLYTYDAFNRLTEIEYPDTTTVTYTYDSRGNLTQMVDSVGTTTYTYDNFDRLTQKTDPYSNTLSYTYDNVNNLKTITYPENLENHIVTYNYDNANRLTSVVDWNNKTTTYTYNNNGTIATRLYPNNVLTTYTYDNANRITDIKYSKSTTTQALFRYTKDSIGNIKIATESGTFISSTPRTIRFNYDNLNRLTSATYPSNQVYSYTYDAVGNRLTSNDPVEDIDRTYTYDDDHKLTQRVDTDWGPHEIDYTYDNKGNRTSRTPGNFLDDYFWSYDFENRVTSYEDANDNLHLYKYDGKGNRLEHYFDTAIKRYLVDESGSLSKVMGTSGGLQNYVSEFNIYGVNDELISVGSGTNTGREWVMKDGMGNIRYTSDSSGNEETEQAFDPFGNKRTDDFFAPDHQFHGQEWDDHSEMYYMRARYYDPVNGQFISKDPVSGILTNPQTIAPYTYSGNNPINMSDPSGEFPPALILAAYALSSYLVVTASTPDFQADLMLTSQDITDCNYSGAAISGASALVPGLSGATVKSVSNVLPYNEARKLTEGFRGEKQAHHILEGRHLKNWGLSTQDAPSVVLDRQTHQEVTNELRKALPFGHQYDEGQVWNAYQNVYKDKPEWLNSISPYFNK